MRSDMKWVLGDEGGCRLAGPRKGRRFSSSEFRKHDWDIDDSLFVAGHVGHALELKLVGGFTRHGRGIYYRPIRRYLSRQVGRSWNDIYSEVSAALRRTRIAEAHWSYLLTMHVSTHMHVIGDSVYFADWRGALFPLSHAQAPKLYVDPRDGRLHRNSSIETPRMRAKRIAAEAAKEVALRRRVITQTMQLHLLADGNWWEVKLRSVHPADLSACNEDVVLRANLSNLRRDVLYGGRHVMAIEKRQLSRREMKRYGLR